jgi:hypothetical protein
MKGFLWNEMSRIFTKIYRHTWFPVKIELKNTAFHTKTCLSSCVRNSLYSYIWRCKSSGCDALSLDEYFPTFRKKIKEIRAIKTSVIICPKTLRHIPRDEYLQQSYSENLQSRTKYLPERKIPWKTLLREIKQEMRSSSWSKNWSLKIVGFGT